MPGNEKTNWARITYKIYMEREGLGCQLWGYSRGNNDDKSQKIKCGPSFDARFKAHQQGIGTGESGSNALKSRVVATEFGIRLRTCCFFADTEPRVYGNICLNVKMLLLINLCFETAIGIR